MRDGAELPGRVYRILCPAYAHTNSGEYRKVLLVQKAETRARLKVPVEPTAVTLLDNESYLAAVEKLPDEECAASFAANAQSEPAAAVGRSDKRAD